MRLLLFLVLAVMIVMRLSSRFLADLPPALPVIAPSSLATAPTPEEANSPMLAPAFAPSAVVSHPSPLATDVLQAVQHASRRGRRAVFATVDDEQHGEYGKQNGVHELWIGPPASTITWRARRQEERRATPHRSAV